MTKLTFTLDSETIARLQATASRLARPKSKVVREAIREFSERMGRLGERERIRMLESFDRLVPRLPARPLREVEREIAEIREARRAGGRRRSRR